jgi:hypothetical protein
MQIPKDLDSNRASAVRHNAKELIKCISGNKIPNRESKSPTTLQVEARYWIKGVCLRIVILIFRS